MPSPDATKKTGIEKLKRIVNSFLSRPDVRAFAEPVNWRELELYDYPEIIKHMMDLGTIKRKLERNQYENGAQVAKDIRLVWSNCMTYNAEESELWLVAKDLSNRFEKKYESLRNQCTLLYYCSLCVVVCVDVIVCCCCCCCCCCVCLLS